MLWTALKWAKCILLIDNFWSVKTSGLKLFIHPFQELTKREIEYIALSRDTTESDLKQRREISSGTAYYVDQCAVRAATKGRVLLLEGIEKAERNVLPVLNNLLENRLVRSEIYFMMLISIFLVLLFFLRQFFAETVFIGFQCCCLTYFLLYSSREMQLEDGRFLMAAERYDSLLKVRPLLTLSEFYFYRLINIFIYIYMNCNIAKG